MKRRHSAAGSGVYGSRVVDAAGYLSSSPGPRRGHVHHTMPITSTMAVKPSIKNQNRVSMRETKVILVLSDFTYSTYGEFTGHSEA